MRINLVFLLVLVMASVCSVSMQAAPSLGGLSCNDTLTVLSNSLGIPDMVRARRADDPTGDFAAFVWQKPALTVVTLNPYGDKASTILTESTSLVTNDGIKVGDPISTVVSKLGKPEETGHEVAGTTEYWYWSQGINFGIDDSKQTVANIFVFPAGKPQTQPQSQSQGQVEMQHVIMPSRDIDIQHHYMTSGGGAYIAGTLRNKATGPLNNVRLGLILMDKNGHIVQMVPVEAGSIPKGQRVQFRAAVPPKGTWTSYRIGIQASSGSKPGQRKYAPAR